jgi:phosphoribosylformylglycinamidine synthase
LSEGGLGVAAAEMALAGGYGVQFDLRKVPAEMLDRDDFVLFSESNSRFLVEVSDKAKKRFESLMKSGEFAEIGTVTKEPRLNIIGLTGESVVDVSIDDLETSWKRNFSTES